MLCISICICILSRYIGKKSICIVSRYLIWQSMCILSRYRKKVSLPMTGKWSPEALACTVLMTRPWKLGNLFNIPTLWINIFGIFLYHPQGQLQAQRGVIKWRPEALVSTVLKLFTWFLGILFNMLALWKDIICIFCYHPQGQPRAQEGVGKWIPGALASTVLKRNCWYFGKHTNP